MKKTTTTKNKRTRRRTKTASIRERQNWEHFEEEQEEPNEQQEQEKRKKNLKGSSSDTFGVIADHDDILIRKYCFKNQDLTPTSSYILFIKGMQDLQMKNSLILFLTEFIKIGQSCSISVCCVVLGNNFVVAFLNNLVVKESVDISFLNTRRLVLKKTVFLRGRVR